MKLMAKVAKGLMLAAFMAVGTTTVNAQEESAETFAPVKVGDWVKGEAVTGNGQKAYIYNVGAGTFISGKSATETDITKASYWVITSGNSTYTFACSNSTEDCIHMNYESDFTHWSKRWVAEIREKSGASDFTLKTGNADNSYRLSRTVNVKVIGTEYQTRYFTVSETSYEAAATATTNSDWLFISTKQKDAYVNYVNSFNELDGYLKNEKVEKEETLLAKIKKVLTKVSSANHSFSTYYGEDGDKATLDKILKEIKEFLDNTPTSIETIKPATDNVKAEAIYDVNGVRQNSLTKGINIVKMSDGTVKKVIKK